MAISLLPPPTVSKFKLPSQAGSRARANQLRTQKGGAPLLVAISRILAYFQYFFLSYFRTDRSDILRLDLHKCLRGVQFSCASLLAAALMKRAHQQATVDHEDRTEARAHLHAFFSIQYPLFDGLLAAKGLAWASVADLVDDQNFWLPSPLPSLHLRWKRNCGAMSEVSSADDLSEFRASFYEECAEMLVSIDDRLSGAPSRIPDIADFNDVFRAVHTIKGLAGFFNLDSVSTFAHAFEALLVALRDSRVEYSADMSALLLDGADALARIIEASRTDEGAASRIGAAIVARIDVALCASTGLAPIQSNIADINAIDQTATHTNNFQMEICFRLLGPADARPSATAAILSELKRMGNLEHLAETSPRASGEGVSEGSMDGHVVRLTTSQSEQAIRDAFAFVEHEISIRRLGEAATVASSSREESAGALPPPAGGSTQAAPVEEADLAARTDQPSPKSTAAITTIRVDLARVDRLVNMVGELVISQAMLAQQISDQHGSSRQALRQSHEDLTNHMRELQECVMAIRMQPVKSVYSRIPRLVREISAKLGKKVRLVMSGEQTEIDKTVIEELGDPLLHMIRNAIDHGIESCDRRRAAGKPEEGLIELSATQRGGNILISLSDDGAGIDRQRVRQKAIERGIIAPDAQMTGEELDQLIFAPGFSTASEVTDVSGRGVGMDVVQNKISNIGGRIHIQSALGRGTKFTLVLPLTLAVLDGMLVSVAGETYILPLTNIVETIRPERRTVRQLANGSVVVALRGEFIRLVSLGDVFGLTGAVTDPSKALVVVVELDNGGKVGLVVDELLGQRQVVVKSLTANFDHVEGVSGATILGTGRVALILDIEQVARSGSRRGFNISIEGNARTSPEPSGNGPADNDDFSPELDVSIPA